MLVDNSFLYSHLTTKLSVPKAEKCINAKSFFSIIENIKSAVTSTKWLNIQDLIDLIFKNSSKFIKTGSSTLHLNVILRVLKLIREEALKFQQGESADFEENLTNRLFATGKEDYCLVIRCHLLDNILASIEEFYQELIQSEEFVASLSQDFLHSDELILTVGYSKDILSSFKYAAENKRQPKVFVADTFPDENSLKMVQELAALNIYSVLIPFSHVHSLMAKVNKVIISCECVFIDGTIKSRVGTLSTVKSAKNYSVPVYVCLPSYKLVPYVPFIHLTKLKETNESLSQAKLVSYEKNNESFEEDINAYYSRIQVLPYNIGENVKLEDPFIKVWSPKWDYIPSGHVDLYITSQGGQSPSYLYAMAREFFHPSDVNTAKRLI